MKKLNQLIPLVLFVFVAFLASCEKEVKLTEEESIVERVTIEQLKQETVNTAIFSDILGNLDISLDKFSKRGVEDKITILTDKILKVKKDSVVTYSFMVETPTSQSSDIENLMIFKYPNNNYRFFIIQYQYTQDEEQPYRIKARKISTEELADFNYSKHLSSRKRYQDGIWFDDCIEVTYTCKYGGTRPHGPELCGPHGNGPGSTMILDFSGCFGSGGFSGLPGGSFKNIYDNPGFDSNDKWNGSRGSNNSTNWGGKTGKYGNSSKVVINNNKKGGAGAAVLCMDKEDINCAKLFHLELEIKLGLTEQKLINYLKKNRDFAEKVFKFYEDNNKTEKVKRFAIEAIKAKTENPNAEIDFGDRVINKLTGKAKCVYKKLVHSGVVNHYNLMIEIYLTFGGKKNFFWR